MGEEQSEAAKLGASAARAAEAAKAKAKVGIGKAKKFGSDCMTKIKESGYLNHISEFNHGLSRPLAQVEELSLRKAKEELVETLKFNPKEPEHGFHIWNATAFYVGVVESLVGLAFGNGYLSLIFNVLVGYIVAYTLFWGMLCKRTKKVMFWTMFLLVAYAAFCAFQIVLSFAMIFSLIMYAFKFLSTCFMAANGFVLYKRQHAAPLLDK